ncbi:hypothetical protein TNCV_3660151 [Trichonephila clavipes]|nr:hypothetical protein TNCV_3660151 [Trichonephila clavipes]
MATNRNVVNSSVALFETGSKGEDTQMHIPITPLFNILTRKANEATVERMLSLNEKRGERPSKYQKEIGGVNTGQKTGAIQQRDERKFILLKKKEKKKKMRK